MKFKSHDGFVMAFCVKGEKMKKRYVILTLLIAVLLAGCEKNESEGSSSLWEEEQNFEQALVTCMTEHRDLYRETYQNLANANVSRAALDEASVAETEPYFTYRIEDIEVQVEKVSAESDSGQDGRTEYRFYRGGELLFTKRLYAMYDKNWVEEPKFYYIDVTGDGEKDILAIVPVMMTGTGPLDGDMVMVYDVKGNAEIPVFDDCVDLTAEQSAQLEGILKKKEAFSILFPQYQYILRSSYSAYADEEGTLYCEFSIWREDGITDPIGNILTALVYNGEKNRFEFDPERIAFLPGY